jgi:uncharacterized RDD family membrane protein YckC
VNEELADPGQRLLGRIVDMLIVGLPVGLVARSDLLGLPRDQVEVVAVLAIAGLSLVYETAQLALWGRTLGKRLAGIRVVRNRPADRLPGGLGPARALLRTATYVLPIALRPVPVFGVVAGIFWVANAAALFEGDRRQALHDRLTDTIVVRAASSGA